MNERSTIKILGINFHNGKVEEVIKVMKEDGGLLVVPAAPGLVNIKEDSDYFESLRIADLVIADSGYMALLWNLTKKEKVNRISGLKFLVAFLNDRDVKASDSIMLINPSAKEAESNFAYFKSNGFNVGEDMSYVAPIYGKDHVSDPELLNLIESKKAKYIIINLGGGVQEKLGAYLKQNLSYKPAIICTGAAIAFLTGQQARIPNWADELYIGWLYRCIKNPKLFIPRYMNSFKLIKLLLSAEYYRPLPE